MTLIALATLVLAIVVFLTSPAPKRARKLLTLAPSSADKQVGSRNRATRFAPLAGLLVGLPVGGIRGLVVGTGVAGLAWLLIRVASVRDDRIRRDELRASLPTIAGQLALCLSAGADHITALGAITESVPPTAKSPLERTVALLELGVPHQIAWQHWEGTADALVRTFERSHRTGAALSNECQRLAADLTAAERSRITIAARSVGVRSVFPLMCCFLPAFVLVGVVPVVVSLARGLLSST